MSRKKKNQQGKQSDLAIAKLAVLAVKLCPVHQAEGRRKAMTTIKEARLKAGLKQEELARNPA